MGRKCDSNQSHREKMQVLSDTNKEKVSYIFIQRLEAIKAKLLKISQARTVLSVIIDGTYDVTVLEAKEATDREPNVECKNLRAFQCLVPDKQHTDAALASIMSQVTTLTKLLKRNNAIVSSSYMLKCESERNRFTSTTANFGKTRKKRVGGRSRKRVRAKWKQEQQKVFLWVLLHFCIRKRGNEKQSEKRVWGKIKTFYISLSRLLPFHAGVSEPIKLPESWWSVGSSKVDLFRLCAIQRRSPRRSKNGLTLADNMAKIIHLAVDKIWLSVAVMKNFMKGNPEDTTSATHIQV